MRVSRSWSRLPQFTPMRTGLALRQATSIISANCGSRLLPRPTLPGLMRYFASACAHAGMRLQQAVAVEMKVADERHEHAGARQPLSDVRHCGRGFVGVDGDAHQFRARRAPDPGPDGRSTRCRPCRYSSSTARRQVRRRRRRRNRCAREWSGGGGRRRHGPEFYSASLLPYAHPSQGMAGESRKGFLSSAEGATARKRSGK